MDATVEKILKDQFETISKRVAMRNVSEMFAHKTEKEVVQMYLLRQVKRQDYLNFMQFKGWEPVLFKKPQQSKELINFLNQLV